MRQIEEVVDEGAEGSNRAPAAGATPSNVRLVSFAPRDQEHALDYDDSCEDLTLHYTQSKQSSSHCLRVLSMVVLKSALPDECKRGDLDEFDLTYSDDNEDWTVCKLFPWSISSNDDDLPQVPAMVDATSPVEIMRDSGADVIVHCLGTMAMLARRLDSMKLSSLTRKGRHCMCAQQELQKCFLERGPQRALHCCRCEHSYSCLGTFGQGSMVIAGVLDDKGSSVDASGSKDDGAASGNNEPTSSGASFVEFCQAVDAAELFPADDCICKSTHCSGDLHGKLSINAMTLQLVLEHLRPGWLEQDISSPVCYRNNSPRVCGHDAMPQ